MYTNQRDYPVPETDWVDLDTFRRYDFMDLCSLGTQQLIDDERVLVSTLHKTAVSKRLSSKLDVGFIRTTGDPSNQMGTTVFITSVPGT